MSKPRVGGQLRLGLVGACVLLAAAFLWLAFEGSLHLAAVRIYDVDECQHVYGAAALVAERAGVPQVTPSLYLLLLVWLAQHADNSVDLFAYSRLISFGLFWINLLLLTLATGEKLLSWRGLIALLGAGTLAPLWEFGLEIRPGNLVLTGLLLTWCILRVSRSGMLSYAISGALAAAMLFTQFDAVACVLPVTMACLLFPHCADLVPRWKLILAWLVGGLVALLGICFSFKWAGLDGNLGAWFTWSAMTSTGGYLSALGGMLRRLLMDTPLVMALSLAGLVDVVRRWRRGSGSVLGWNSYLPEAVMFLVAFMVLLVNPSPLSLLILGPFAFLFAFRYFGAIANEIRTLPAYLPVTVCLLVFGHLAPFLIAAWRHSEWPNYRQEALMRLAESITEPRNDPVWDGIGLVPTRQNIGFERVFQDLGHSESSLSGVLITNPAPVIIMSYRTDWLPEAAHAFIRSNYVAVSDEFWVLGTVLPPGGGGFEVIRGGRYRISTLEGSDLAGTYPTGLDRTPEVPGTLACTLDGVEFANRPVELAPGIHHLKTTADCQAAIVWVGPHRDRLHRQGTGNHRLLFCNSY